MSTRRSQPYRKTDSRAPSATLEKMQAGRAAGAPQGAQGTPKRRSGPRVPRTTPTHRRR